MRVPLSTILILAVIHVAKADLLGVVLDNTVDAVTGVTMELPSDAANAGCKQMPKIQINPN